MFAVDLGESNPADPDIVFASGADRYPSSTAADWATYADHVVVVTVTDERIIQPAEIERKRGEGLILRDLTMRVDDLIWSSTEARTAAPSTFQWPALGWEFTSDPIYREMPMTGAAEPRLEVDNTYLMAIEKPDPKCDRGGKNKPLWRGLGAAAVVPFEGGTVGAGEFEGTTTQPLEAKEAWTHQGSQFAASMAGAGGDEVRGALNAADIDRTARTVARRDKCRV